MKGRTEQRTSTYVALLRGINVGASTALPMTDLVAILVSLGARDVTTYARSGNAVFRSAEEDPARLAKQLGMAVSERRGFEPFVLVLRPEAIAEAMARNPFPDAEADPGRLHLGFLALEPEDPDLAGIEGLRKDSERYRLIGAVFYLHAPDGVGRSRLAAGAEKLLGVPMTDRNWRTVGKLRALADGMATPPC